jgi:hypothetical protein
MGSKIRNFLFVLAGIAAFLSGCETLDPYTGESERAYRSRGRRRSGPDVGR